MAWLAISDQDGFQTSSVGLGDKRNGRDQSDVSNAAVMPKGSLVIETGLPVTHRPMYLLQYSGHGRRPLMFSLQSVPGGGLSFVLDRGGDIVHRTINHSTTGRANVLRITYSWDSDRGWAQLGLERVDQDQVMLVRLPPPGPMAFNEAVAIVRPRSDRYVSPEVRYIALSNKIEPVGPVPTLTANTPISTPSGYRPIKDIRQGDLIQTPTGESVPVLQVVSRQVPARGSLRPVRMRAPYFGLQQDITVSPSQRLVLSGSEVEYLFGRESVLVPARHLAISCRAAPVPVGPVIRYYQLLLPRHEALIAAGTVTESLFIGRLRRKQELLATSILAGIDRNTLPEHGRSVHPILQEFEAVILAENRAA